MNKLKRTIAVFAALTLLLAKSVMLFGCSDWTSDYEWGENSFSLTIEVCSTEVRLGDEITITATFKNLSGRNLNLYMYVPDRSDVITPFVGHRTTRCATQMRIFNTFNAFAPTTWGSTHYKDGIMYYSYRYKFERDAEVVLSGVIKFVYDYYFWYTGIDGLIPTEKQQIIIIPKTLIYCAFFISFYTSRNINLNTRVVLSNLLKFNILPRC